MANFENFTCPIPLSHNDQIMLAHGSGGRKTANLVRDLFYPLFDNPMLGQGDDFAACPQGQGRLVISTDSHIVKPLFFPGGDIGRLSVCGTVNDVAMSGAQPLYLTAGFILEEGLQMETLWQVISSMRHAMDEAGVSLVAGDTKVVERGSGDGIFITTTGVGWLPENVSISGANAQPGDVVIVSGTLGDHGIAVLAARGELGFETPIVSDVAPLNGLIRTLLEHAPDTHVLRDPTRGGLATTLNEIAAQSGVSIQIEESAVPINRGVRSACDMLGFDPLYVANEGKLIVILPESQADAALAAIHTHPYGEKAAVIGRVTEGHAGWVTLKTRIGGTRLLDMLTGEMLPRIC